MNKIKMKILREERERLENEKKENRRQRAEYELEAKASEELGNEVDPITVDDALAEYDQGYADLETAISEADAKIDELRSSGENG